MKKNLFLSILISLSSCKQDLGPEQVLRSYINLRFQPGVEITELIGKTTGELKESLESLKFMSSEEKAKFDQSSQLKKKSLKILSRDCEKISCKITYIISYDREIGSNPYNAQIRNIAKLNKVDGIWKIASVGGLKTYFESKKSIEP